MHTHLGQHFLKNKGAIKRIIDALDLQINDTVIEIGPGSGALTLPLAENPQFQISNSQLIAIEKDKKLAEELKQKIQKLKIRNVKIVEGNALKELPNTINDLKLGFGNWKLVGNIPYYITGKLLRTISELESKPARTVLMIQKEVAERAVARPPKMNLLAAATQFWAEPKILFSLKPNDFDPPPKVDSAVIQLTTNEKQPTTDFSKKYYELLHNLFKQPRKTILNNLKSGLSISKNDIESALLAQKLPLNARPQDLSLEEIKMLVADFHS